MIRILQGWKEIGEAILALQGEGLPTHRSPQKNWDHFWLRKMLQTYRQDATIVDLGCGEGHTLVFLSALGFRNIHGVDLVIEWQSRVKRGLVMWRRRTLKPPFRLHKGDITKTPFSAASVDVAVSISTIEHGVDTHELVGEVSRILKPGGLFFVTSDYWDPKIVFDGFDRPYGLPWNVFCRAEIEGVIGDARRVGLLPCQGAVVPPCAEAPVFWEGHRFTFIGLMFEKVPARSSACPDFEQGTGDPRITMDVGPPMGANTVRTGWAAEL